MQGSNVRMWELRGAGDRCGRRGVKMQEGVSMDMSSARCDTGLLIVSVFTHLQCSAKKRKESLILILKIHSSQRVCLSHHLTLMLTQPNLCMLELIQHISEQARPNMKTSKQHFSKHKHAMLHDHAHGMVFLLVLIVL